MLWACLFSLIYHQQWKKTTQNIRAARHCPRPRITTADHVTPQLRQCRLQKEKRPASAALMVTRLAGFFFFFFSSWISTDTLCHLKTIFPTASVHTEGNYHLANPVRQTHGNFFGSHDLLTDLCLSHSLESVMCFGFIQSTVSSAAFAQQYFNGNIFRG